MNHILCKVLISISLLLFGCTKEFQEKFFRAPEITPVRNVLNVAIPLAYAANLTMSALNGVILPNVTIVRTGSDTSAGCLLMRIKVDSTFPLPGDVRANGNILMAGISVDNKTAIMTAVFTEMNILHGSFMIRDISTFPVVSDSDIITGKKQLVVVYADIDANTGSDTLLSVGISQNQITAELTKYNNMASFDSGGNANENAWIIRVTDNNTLTDATDDNYIVSGGGQYIEESQNKNNFVQLVMINATMSAACKFNPASGYAYWHDFGTNENPVKVVIGQVFLSFHNACDGQAKITVATGSYAHSFGDNIALNLGN